MIEQFLKTRRKLVCMVVGASREVSLSRLTPPPSYAAGDDRDGAIIVQGDDNVMVPAASTRRRCYACDVAPDCQFRPRVRWASPRGLCRWQPGRK